MSERWDNTAINLETSKTSSVKTTRSWSSNIGNIRNEAPTASLQTPGQTRTAMIESSGSRGMLGKVLEKMHEGMILSQHEMSAALREFNQLQTRMADLQRLEDKMKVKTDYDETKIMGSPESEKKPLNGDVRTAVQIEQLQNKLDRKQKFIEELQKKLKDLGNDKVSRGRKDILVSDLAPPAKIVDSFCDLYAREWSSAFEALKTTLRDEEQALMTLFRVIRHAYVFCYDIAAHQRTMVEGLTDKLEETLLHPSFIHPISKLKYRATAAVDDETRKHIDMGRNMVMEYRNILVTRSAPGIQELFRKVKLPEIFDGGFVSKSMKTFTDKLVELIWLMVIQDPPMLVYWLEPGKTVLSKYFNVFDTKGEFVKTTVWPAIFLKKDGDILSKGVVKT